MSPEPKHFIITGGPAGQTSLEIPTKQHTKGCWSAALLLTSFTMLVIIKVTFI